jgi:hypothetical protein
MSSTSYLMQDFCVLKNPYMDSNQIFECRLHSFKINDDRKALQCVNKDMYLSTSMAI